MSSRRQIGSGRESWEDKLKRRGERDEVGHCIMPWQAKLYHSNFNLPLIDDTITIWI